MKIIKNIKEIIVVMLIIFLAILLNKESAFAASGKIEINTEESQVLLDNDFNVYINISSDTIFGNFEAYLVYDDEILDYIGGSSVISGGGGFLNISDINTSEEGYSRKYALQFKAKKVGSSNIGFQNKIMLYDFEHDMEMAVSSNSIAIDVKTAEEASDNTYLRTLKINPGILDPEFNKDTYFYETNVEYYVDQLIVEALSEDTNAKVKISGNDSLGEGENKIVITVVAESGETAEYNINLSRDLAPTEDDETDIDDKENPNTAKNEFEIKETDGELIISYIGSYTIVEPDSTTEIPSGYSKTRIIISGHSIDAYYPEDNINSEFLLIYAMNEQGELGFYTYDRSEKTIQRFVTDSWGGKLVEEDEEVISSRQYRSNMNKAIIVITILGVTSIGLIILSISLYMKTRDQEE